MIRSSIRLAFTFVTLSLASSLPAQADELTFVFEAPAVVAGDGLQGGSFGNVLVPQFDPAFGCLTEARLTTLDGRLDYCQDYRNNSASDIAALVQMKLQVLSLGPTGWKLVTPHMTIGSAQTLSPMQVYQDCPTGIPYGNGTIALGFGQCPNQQHFLIGTGAVPFVASLVWNAQPNPTPGLEVLENTATWRNTFEVRYTYTPHASTPGLNVGSGDGGDQLGCTDCPCNNNAPVGTIGGCLNSAGQSARIYALGTPSVAADTLSFRMTGGVPSAFGILLSGSELLPQNMANPCHGLGSGVTALGLDGLRVAGVGIRRHGGRSMDESGSAGFLNNGWGPPSNPLGGFSAQAGFTAGESRHFQVIYRDFPNLSCGTGLNTSQAVSVTFTP